MPEVKIEKSVHEEQVDWDVTLTRCGNITDVRIMERIGAGPPVIKIDKGHYMDRRTGEVIEAKEYENRAEGKDSIGKTLRKIREVINCNCQDGEKLRWVTLTYKENMTDPKRLYKDFHAFWKRFKRYLETKGYESAEYISVIEPQERGAWHCHVIMIWEGKAPYIPNSDLYKIWGNGFVRIQAVNGVDNIGAYFSAYLADIPLDEFQGMAEESCIKEVTEQNGKTKAFVKGGRLKLYPAGMNILRTSKGVKRPEIETMSFGEYEEKKLGQSMGALTYHKRVMVTIDGRTINRFTRLSYNKERKFSNGA